MYLRKKSKKLYRNTEFMNIWLVNLCSSYTSLCCERKGEKCLLLEWLIRGKGQRWGGRKDSGALSPRRIKRLNYMLTLISGLVCGWCENAGVNGLKKEPPWIRGYQDSCNGLSAQWQGVQVQWLWGLDPWSSVQPVSRGPCALHGWPEWWPWGGSDYVCLL